MLIFVGPASSPEYAGRLADLAAAAPDSRRIVFAGRSREPETWLRAADVFLSCSKYEGMPLGPLEAAGSGLPCLLSDIPGHHLLEGFCDYLPGKIEEGAATLERLIRKIRRDPERLRARLWHESGCLREQFSVEMMVRRYAALYEENNEAELPLTPESARASAAPSSGGASLVGGI